MIWIVKLGMRPPCSSNKKILILIRVRGTNRVPIGLYLYAYGTLWKGSRCPRMHYVISECKMRLNGARRRPLIGPCRNIPIADHKMHWLSVFQNASGILVRGIFWKLVFHWCSVSMLADEMSWKYCPMKGLRFSTFLPNSNLIPRGSNRLRRLSKTSQSAHYATGSIVKRVVMTILLTMEPVA